MTFSPVSTSSKRAIVEMAYEECSLAGYEFDRTPEEYAVGLRRLDALMAELAPTLPLGYNRPGVFGGGDLDEPSGIPDFAVDVVAKYLALRIAPTMGKEYAGTSRYALAAGLVGLRAQLAVLPTVTLPNTTPRGAGNKPWSTWYPFIRNDEANLAPTLAALSLTSSAAVAGAAFSTVIIGTSPFSTLYLTDDVGGLYSLTSTVLATYADGTQLLQWSLNRAAFGALATTDYPVVRELLAGAFNSPSDNRFTVAVGASPTARYLRFNAAANSGYIPVLAL